MMHSIKLITALAAALVIGTGAAMAAEIPVAEPPKATADQKPVVEVWMSPDCHCCKGWVAYMQEAGFTIESYPVSDPELEAMKKRSGVPDELASCHTAKVGGYVVEGHVPAADILRLLNEHPQATGISVPKMPNSAPGMTPVGNDAYQVILFGPNGAETVYSKH
jgi:hypothetical protein